MSTKAIKIGIITIFDLQHCILPSVKLRFFSHINAVINLDSAIYEQHLAKHLAKAMLVRELLLRPSTADLNHLDSNIATRRFPQDKLLGPFSHP